VFVVGSLGRPCPAEILFEPESGERNPETGRETWENLAGTITGGTGRVGSRGADDGANIVAALFSTDGGYSPDKACGNNYVVAAPLTAGSFDRSHAPGRRREDDENLVATLNSGGNNGGFRTEPGEHLVAYALRRDPGGIGQGHNTSYAVTENMRNRSQGPANYVRAEIDRDRMRDFTGLPEGMDNPLLPGGLDSARYRQLGNAVTVEVARWIGRRIAAYGS
jgi:site-specific DNA-cytosine methylase